MEVEIKIDKNVKEPKVVIYSNSISEDIQKLANKIQEYSPNKVIGEKEDETFILDQNEIESFFTEDNKVYARKEKDKFKVRRKIYELEEMLQGTAFIRISNAEIANFDLVESLEIDGSKEICLKFKSGNYTYVSRRNISKIKKYLGL